MRPALAERHALRESRRDTRREFLKAVLGASASLAMRREGFAGSQTARNRPLRWKTHLVAKIPHGYQLAVADVNADGLPDVLALSSEESIVAWYENPAWQARAVATKTKKNISLAPLVFPKGGPGGFWGIALATDFALEESTRGGSLWRAEPGPSPESEWALDRIGEIPTAHRLRWADLDGDGRPELVVAPIVGRGAQAPDYAVGAPLTWFALPAALTSTPRVRGKRGDLTWTPHLIDDSLTVVHGINVLDWDGDGRDEILTASFEGVHLFHSSGRGRDLRWAKVRIASGDQSRNADPRRGSSEIGVGKIGGRRFLASIEPWHGEQVVVYFESERGGLWRRQVIDTSFHDGHALACADLDGDGNDEIVAGFRGQGTSLCLYKARGPHPPEEMTWERQTIDTDMAASGVVIADLNGDGWPDIASIGASTGNVKWYENAGAEDESSR